MKDLFSAQAGEYARYRPVYLAEMVAWISQQAPVRQLAWDCATGNGQLAVLLADHFEKVVATDASQKQLEQATPKANIEYRLEKAESSSLADSSVDLIAVAQAVHWFGFDAFYGEVRRVARPGALIALIGYGLLEMESPQIRALIWRLYTQTTGPFWETERRYIDEGYRTLPFPFEEISTPSWSIQVEWTPEQVVGFLSSWSAVQRFKTERGFDPLDSFRQELENVWGSAPAIPITFPVLMRLGKVG